MGFWDVAKNAYQYATATAEALDQDLQGIELGATDISVPEFGEESRPRLPPLPMPPLDTSMALREPSMAQVYGGGESSGGGAERNGGAMDTTDLVYAVQDRIGKAISKKAIVRFILKYGWQFAQLAFGLNQQAQALLVVDVKAKPKRRRGPHLYTVLKRIRSGRRYEKMLRRYSAKAGLGRGRSHGHSGGGKVVRFRKAR